MANLQYENVKEITTSLSFLKSPDNIFKDVNISKSFNPLKISVNLR